MAQDKNDTSLNVAAPVGTEPDDHEPLQRPRLKWAILLPFSVIVVLTVFAFVYAQHAYEQEELESESARINSSIHYLYQKGIVDHAEILGASIDSIIHDKSIAEALVRKDRQSLLGLSHEYFAEIKAKYGVTHLYFTGLDRVNLLRVHQPARFGDVIDRFTMLESERSGAPSYGMEIGPLGTFTLRYVYPWYMREGGSFTLIGYVEAGMEIEHLFDEIEEMMGVGISVFIEKSILKRESWEEGVKMLGRVPDWERFDNLVSTAFRKESISAPLLDQFTSSAKGLDIAPKDMASGEVQFRVVPVSLKDVSKQHIGYAVAFLDVSAKKTDARTQVLLVMLIAVFVGLVLFIFFYRLLDATEKRLIEADERLRILATHDGLTGLLNHRMFQMRLEQESQRAARYDKQLSMLMIDIDFFKKVNDNYGHHIGDVVLKRVSDLIAAQCRNVDTVCRYGGEEMAVLLPETPLEEGVHVAERIRRQIEKDDFKESGVEGLKVTVSIGVSAFPSHAESHTELSHSADEALYLAKDSGRNQVMPAGKN